MRPHAGHSIGTRGFTISGASMFILIAFLAVSVGHAIWANTQAGWPSSKWVQFVLLLVALPLVLAVALTMAAYFLTRKSNGAANVTLSTLLLLMIGGRVALWTGVIPKDFSFRKVTSPSGATAAQTNEGAESSRALRVGQPEGSAAQGAARAPEADASSVAPPPGEGTMPTTIAAPTRVAESPSSPAFKDVAAWIALKEPRTTDALAALAVELDGSVDEVLDKAARSVDLLARTGRPSNRALDERIAMADAGKQLAEALVDRLFRLNDEASRVIKGSRAAASAHNFVFHSAAGSRSIAARQYADFFAAVSQQSALLRNNQSKWSLNADGSVNAKEAKLRVDLNAPSFTIDVFLQREKSLRSQLQGR